MIGREEAIETLRNLVDTDVLSEDIQSKLDQIATCIEEEQDGRHIWGTEDDDWMELHIAHRDDMWTEDLYQKLNQICEKYSFVPAPQEVGDFVKEAEEADV